MKAYPSSAHATSPGVAAGGARRLAANAALIAGMLIAGCLCGIAVRMSIGGLKQQHAQLERCVLDSKRSHRDEDARAAVARLDVEIPACMDVAGYAIALDNENCGAALWQGDLFCYLPKSYLGRLIYRIETKYQRPMQQQP